MTPTQGKDNDIRDDEEGSGMTTKTTTLTAPITAEHVTHLEEGDVATVTRDGVTSPTGPLVCHLGGMDLTIGRAAR